MGCKERNMPMYLGNGPVCADGGENCDECEARKKNSEEPLFKVDGMFRLPDAGSLKAFVDVSIGDMIVIKGFRVMEGNKGKGLFVTTPREQGKDAKLYDVVLFKDGDLFADMERVVLKQYKKGKP